MDPNRIAWWYLVKLLVQMFQVVLSASVNVLEPAILSVNLNNNGCVADWHNGSISASVNGGIAPYHYTWSSFWVILFLRFWILQPEHTVTVTWMIMDVQRLLLLLWMQIRSTRVCVQSGKCNAVTEIPTEHFALRSCRRNAAVYFIPDTQCFFRAVANDWLPVCIALQLQMRMALLDPPVVPDEPAPLAVLMFANNVNCHGAMDGFIYRCWMGGGTLHSYQWNPGGRLVIRLLTCGRKLRCDCNWSMGCFTSSASISEPDMLTATVSSNDVTCFSAQNGSASVNISGGIQPYYLNWCNGDTGWCKIICVPEHVRLQFRDGNGCFIDRTFTISEPALIEVSLQHGMRVVRVVQMETLTAAQFPVVCLMFSINGLQPTK